MQAVLMSARNTIVMEVLMHNGSGELMVKALGEGARDWFKEFAGVRLFRTLAIKLE